MTKQRSPRGVANSTSLALWLVLLLQKHGDLCWFGIVALTGLDFHAEDCFSRLGIICDPDRAVVEHASTSTRQFGLQLRLFACRRFVDERRLQSDIFGQEGMHHRREGVSADSGVTNEEFEVVAIIGVADFE